MLPSSLSVLADAYYVQQAQTARQVANLVQRSFVTIADPAEWWDQHGFDAAQAVRSGQTVAATRSVAYVKLVGELQDAADDYAVEIARLVPPDEVVDGMLLRSLALAEQAIADGATVAEARTLGLRNIVTLASSMVADAGQNAAGVAIAANQHLTGYYRKLRLPSCDRCAVMAGRWYEWNEGFQRHPNCFPEGVTVSGPSTEGAARRWYEGELVILTTASGQEVALTGNHPVLTRRGWVPANLIKEGDEVFRSTRTEGATSLVVPDHDQVPSRIEDVWSALSVAGFDSMESAPEDFHGDGQHGEVDVVRADRALYGDDLAGLYELLSQCDLARTAGAALALNGERAAVLLDLGLASHSRGPVGLSGLSLALHGGHREIADLAGGAHVASLDASLAKGAGNGSTGHAVGAGERILARAGFVFANNSRSVNRYPLARWDAPTLSDPLEQRRAYASVGADLAQRLAGQVEPDRVVFSRSVDFRGHVYSLTSSEGWHAANSLIVSNCDCVHVPVSEAYGSGFDPRRAILSGQVTGLSKADREAIEMGADPSQVINTKGKGRLYPVGGGLQATHFGTTRRGRYGRTAGERTKHAGSRYTRASAPRLTPSSILRMSSSRSDALRLLTRYGYIAA